MKILLKLNQEQNENFIKIHRKYKIKKELQKIEPKNRFRDAKLGGRGPVFIDTLSKSWPLD